MTILVCGGRDYNDAETFRAFMDAILDSYGPFEKLIHGGQDGADALAEAWASEHGIPTQPFPADWQQFGKSAGPRRNAEMLKLGQPDLVVAFPGNRGTEDMVAKATRAGVRVVRV